MTGAVDHERIDVIPQLSPELTQDGVPRPWILEGEEELVAPIEVARHPVGAPAPDFPRAAALERRDPRVLEESAHDAARANARRDAR